ncbi:MAG: diguanylate cyclase [Eubacteriales bacterium]|nr:diguanylate cyclase [Eubacteriales bacterium]
MKKFDVFRYLRTFGLLIAVFVLLGVAAVFLYVRENQQYTANVSIKYTNREIEEGMAPDGSKLDPNEIYSTPVISNAMTLLDSKGPLNIIRSKCSVTAVIPEDQMTITNALLDKGEESTYFPDTYVVSLVVDESYGPMYARRVLEAIMQSYCSYYTEKYVERALSLTPSTNLIANGYEYYQSIDILSDDTDTMIDYLSSKKDDYPSFRSSKYGYCFADVYDKYIELRNFYIPELYCTVLSGPQIKDGNILREFLQNEISNSLNDEENNKKKKELIETLINDFVERNRDIVGGTIEGADDYTRGVLSLIEEYDGSAKLSTYDDLILKLVEIEKAISDDQIDRAFTQEVQKAFGEIGSGSSGSPAEHAKVEKMITDYENELLGLYEIVNDMSIELNSTLGSKYLKMLGTVHVYQSINAKLYVLLAFALFMLVGIGAAIVLGRLGDFIYYLVSIDKKTKLPNRERINEYIDVLAKKLLPEDYSIIAFSLENLNETSRKYGYQSGDTLIGDFSAIIKLIEEDGFVGYNGSGLFLAFIENCRNDKAAAIVEVIDGQIIEYNASGLKHPIVYKSSIANTSSDKEYRVRDLLRKAIVGLRNARRNDATEEKQAEAVATPVEESKAPVNEGENNSNVQANDGVVSTDTQEKAPVGTSTVFIMEAGVPKRENQEAETPNENEQEAEAPKEIPQETEDEKEEPANVDSSDKEIPGIETPTTEPSETENAALPAGENPDSEPEAAPEEEGGTPGNEPDEEAAAMTAEEDKKEAADEEKK